MGTRGRIMGAARAASAGPLFFGPALAWLVGCGGQAAFVPKDPFPAKATVADLAATPVKALPARAMATFPAWRIETADVPESQTALETRYATLAGKEARVVYTRELRCVAREVGRAFLEENAEPELRLQRLIGGACGLTTEGLTYGYVTGTAPETMGDEELVAKWADKLHAPAGAAGKPAGMWLSRKKDQVVLVLAAELAGAGLTVAQRSDGRATLRGRLKESADLVLALVNRGAAGVAPCDADPKVARPDYSFTCAMAEGDATAWVQLAAQRPEHLLLHPVAQVLLRRDRATPVEYAPGASRASTASPGDVDRTIVDGINRLRATAKLGQLTLAPSQSAVNQRLVGHYFNAALASDEAKAELVALGLIAGWDVTGGVIRNGDLFSALMYGTTDGARWLDYALDSPLGRFTLLSADAREIAVGSQIAEGNQGLAAIVTTYAFFESNDHTADANRMFERLNRARASKNLPPATRAPRVPSLAEQAKLVNAGEKDAMEALESALNAERDRAGSATRGWIAAGTNVEVLPLPPDLLAPGPLTVAVEVTHFRPKEAAWGFYVVYFLTAGTGQ